MDKRAFFTRPIALIVAIFAIIMIFFIFSMIFSFVGQKTNFDIKQNSAVYEAHVQLVHLLRSPVTVQGVKTDYAGYIAMVYEDEDL